MLGQNLIDKFCVTLPDLNKEFELLIHRSESIVRHMKYNDRLVAFLNYNRSPEMLQFPPFVTLCEYFKNIF